MSRLKNPIAALIAALILAGCVSVPEPPRVAPAPPPAPPPNLAPAESPPSRTEAQVIATVQLEYNIFFEQGSAEIGEVGKATLRHHAEHLKANPKERVSLIGHAESFGSRGLSVAIADKRVSSVYAKLREYGVSPRQLLRANAGVEENSKACQSPECRQLMRRVELKYAKIR